MQHAGWAVVPFDVLEQVGALLSPESLRSGRLACSAWRHGLSAGVSTLRPRFSSSMLHSLGSSDKRCGVWGDLAAAPRVFPRLATLDLRRCKATDIVVRMVARCVPRATTVHLRVGVTVSVNKRKQVGNVQRLMKALKEVGQQNPQQAFLLEFHVLDGPFWWNDNLGDGALQRMFGSIPSNAEMRTLDLSEHVCQNLSRPSFELVARAMPQLRELTLVNSSAVSSSAVAELASLTALTGLHLGSGMPVTNATLASTLSGMRRLVTLTLIELQRITDPGVEALAALQLPCLKRIGLHGFAGITNAAAAALRQLPALRVVDVRNCGQIDDAGLAHLAALPALRVADARGCHRVTGRGAAVLRARTGGRVIVLLGDADAVAVVQAAAADRLAAAAAAADPAVPGGCAEIPADVAAAAGSLVAGADLGGKGSRGCPLYAKHYDRAYARQVQGG